MERMKRMSRTWAMLALAAAVGSGCAASKVVQWTDPQPDGYYTGGQADPAARINPDPLGRKFRVAYLSVYATKWDYPDNARREMSAAVKGDVAFRYMALREQAENSPARKALSESMVRTQMAVCRTGRTFVLNWLANVRDPKKLYSMASPRDQAFLAGYPGAEWLRRVNSELAARYPSLFSREADAFPLDVVVEILFDGSGNKRIRSLCEAWLLGIPEHASITYHDTVTDDAIFKAEEGFLDPHDAIAAAVSKLTEAQLEWLEPANPRDHEWLEEN